MQVGYSLQKYLHQEPLPDHEIANREPDQRPSLTNYDGGSKGGPFGGAWGGIRGGIWGGGGVGHIVLVIINSGKNRFFRPRRRSY